MAYNNELAARVRIYLAEIPSLQIEEKKMFGGLAFMINDKMCINVSKDRLMCRFDSNMEEEVSQKVGFEPMNMKGRKYKGYCYVHPEGFEKEEDLAYWVNLCLDFNEHAKSSKK